MIIEYNLNYKPNGFGESLSPSRCCGNFETMESFERFKTVEDNRGRVVTDEKVISNCTFVDTIARLEEDTREVLHIPVSLRRDEFGAKLEHQLDIARGKPCQCCKPLVNFENYRKIFEDDYLTHYPNHKGYRQMLKVDHDYWHEEVRLSWEYFKKGLVMSMLIEIK